MKKLLLTSTMLVAYGSAAQAQSQLPCTNCGVVTSCNGVVCSTSTGMSYMNVPDESTLAVWAARKAIEIQQSNWWNEKKVSELARTEVDERVEHLNALCKWAETLSNHIFGKAYIDWATAKRSELAARRETLDKLDVALSLVKGLPQPPDSVGH